jgi:hypothetical protein
VRYLDSVAAEGKKASFELRKAWTHDESQTDFMQMNMYIEVRGFQTCFYSPGHLFPTLLNNQTVSLSYTKIPFLAATIQNVGLGETVPVWCSISVLIYRVYWIDLCVCTGAQKKMLWAMKLLDLVVWICFLSYLEWTYDSRCNRVTKVFDRILEDQWKWWKGTMIFQCSAK